MTENEKIELFDKWYDENYDEWAEGEEGIALREELEQAFKGGIAELEQENAELKRDKEDLIFIRNQNAKCMCEDKEILTKAKEIIKKFCTRQDDYCINCTCYKFLENMRAEAEQFLNSEVEK